ncbi:mitogen-activated protein kinase kinase, putative [Entamoeba invadens IP1]|uniref:Mitogen-activated protein kinase kinase, putative n=1 Tax=Entamoeba invadens IP1 TaxID=370355 RepID=A0A0A1UEH4_ENTIV|nr:mitogen-activated protein kinase kinase, putative [Entamoeba invadens IP1]ELP92196.1 mitogen-activated protein kinase kinase, putative [Entamoeba invadens IP1]|eukprot:XP_004258967.1 mitogen-activated protein kinase kinase, putative [Entamoeba invadens IP1]
MSINRAVRRMPNGDLCQFMIYRIQTDLNNSSLNTALQARAEILKVNQMHIYNEKTKISKIPTLREKDHPYVIKCCGGFFASPYNNLEFWIVCEYSTNTTLLSYMNKNEPFFSDEVLTISYALVKILNYCYIEFRAPYIHLIPQNIFLGRNPTSPFPQAKISPYAFMPHRGHDEADAQPFISNDFRAGVRAEIVSVWSFGVILYRMITGVVPRVDENCVILESELKAVDHLEAANLIRQCVNAPFHRPSLEALRRHPFIQECHLHTKLPKIEPNFEVLTVIGKGQFGSVVHAVDKRIGINVAIKESFGTQLAYLQKDARTMRACHCPQLVEYYGYFQLSYSLSASFNSTFGGVSDTHGYLVMELCSGGNLEEYLMRYPGSLPSNYIRSFLRDISLGLRYLHFVKGLVHRDLKPENILLCPFQPNEIPQVKITDYGFSRAILDDKLASEKGSLLFEAPEIMRHEVYSSKSDLYSLGIILYHLCTKAWPFGCQKDSFFEGMTLRKSVQFPPSVFIEEYLKDLMCKLITHEESQRIGWKEYFVHPYVQICLYDKEDTKMSYNKHEMYCFN